MGDISELKKRPVTSTAIAHSEKTLQTTGYDKLATKTKCPTLLQSLLDDPIIRDSMKSEMKTQYTIKYDTSEALKNPSLGGRINYMKPYVDAKLSFVERSIIPQRSTTHYDYAGRDLEIPEPEMPPLPTYPSPIGTTPIFIDYSKEGYSKYIDPSATTYRLSFPHYSAQFIDNSIARKDNITFYNWHLHYKPLKRVFPGSDDIICQECPSHKCKKRSNEFQSQVRAVPHKGLITEVQERFRDPKNHPHYIEIDRPAKKFIVNVDNVESFKQTEAMIIGSGERTEKYV